MTDDHLRARDDVVVDRPADRLDAELRRGALGAAGISSRLSTDDAGGMHPHLGPMASGLQLRVDRSRAEEARTVLAELDAGTWALDELEAGSGALEDG